MLTDYNRKCRDEFMAGLRGLLEWMEEHPEMPAPTSMDTGNIYAGTKERLIELRRDCGLREKLLEDGDYEYAGFKKVFSPAVQVHLFVMREVVCRRVQVGEKVVPATPEMVVPAKEERVEPVYKWQCDEPLLAADNGDELVLSGEHAEAQ